MKELRLRPSAVLRVIRQRPRGWKWAVIVKDQISRTEVLHGFGKTQSQARENGEREKVKYAMRHNLQVYGIPLCR